MGKFFVSQVWLEDREIEILESFNFKREIYESEIPENKLWILHDLEIKGFLYSVVLEEKNRFGDTKYYHGSVCYLQHFHNK